MGRPGQLVRRRCGITAESGRILGNGGERRKEWGEEGRGGLTAMQSMIRVRCAAESGRGYGAKGEVRDTGQAEKIPATVVVRDN